MKSPRWVNESDESTIDESNMMSSSNDGLHRLNDSLEIEQTLGSEPPELEGVRLTLQSFTIG